MKVPFAFQKNFIGNQFFFQAQTKYSRRINCQHCIGLRRGLRNPAPGCQQLILHRFPDAPVLIRRDLVLSSYGRIVHIYRWRFLPHFIYRPGQKGASCFICTRIEINLGKQIPAPGMGCQHPPFRRRISMFPAVIQRNNQKIQNPFCQQVDGMLVIVKVNRSPV